MPNKTEKEKLIEQLKEQIAKAEAKGLFDTAHHDMLKQLMGEKKEIKKGDLENG